MRPARGITTAALVVGMTALLAFVAVAVDVALLSCCRTEARAAADAAALAGAAELWDRSLLPSHLQGQGLPAPTSSISTRTVAERQMSHCVDRVCRVAAQNTVGGQPVTLSQEDLSFASLAGGSALSVQCSFTQQRGNPVRRVIGQTLGLSDADLLIQSQAVLDQRVAGFAASTTANAPVIPIVIRDGTWNSQVATSAIVTIQLTADGSQSTGDAKLCLLQSPTATVVVDHLASAPNTVVNQIQSGIRKADVASLPGQMIALSSTTGRPLELAAAPVSRYVLGEVNNALQSIVGRPRVWMLTAVIGNTNESAGYQVSSFVAAKVLACAMDGDRLTVVLAPCPYATSTAIVHPNQLRNPWLAKVCLVQ
ncbi:MAG: pilus assembly protein TadG-related protein [Planctomycetota bacterium]